VLRNRLEREKRYCEALAREIWPKASRVHIGSAGREIVCVDVDGTCLIHVPAMPGASRAVALALNSYLDVIREREEAARRRREAKGKVT
jgi:hypothetical protein